VASIPRRSAGRSVLSSALDFHVLSGGQLNLRIIANRSHCPSVALLRYSPMRAARVITGSILGGFAAALIFFLFYGSPNGSQLSHPNFGKRNMAAAHYLRFISL